MTGYLHIPTDELAAKLAQWFEETLTYDSFMRCDDQHFAERLTAFLRGLSVEPTEALGWDGVGIGEAAEILEVSKQRVDQLRKHPDFPAPVLRVRAGPVWQREDIARYAAVRNRLSGRPSLGAPVPVQEDRP